MHRLRTAPLTSLWKPGVAATAEQRIIVLVAQQQTFLSMFQLYNSRINNLCG